MSVVIKLLTFCLTSGVIGLVSLAYFEFFYFIEKRMNSLLWLYVGWASAVTILLGLLSVITVHLLVSKKNWNIYLISLSSAVIFTAAGVFLNTIVPIAAFVFYEYLQQLRY